VLTSAFGLFLRPIPIVVLSFGVFVKAFAQEFHSGRAAVSFALTLHNLMIAVVLPFAGRLVDRFGARKVILAATVMSG
jgi:MFS family permease